MNFRSVALFEMGVITIYVLLMGFFMIVHLDTWQAKLNGWNPLSTVKLVKKLQSLGAFSS